jgi:ribosomal protein S27AE
VDLEALETALRDAVHAAGAKVLEVLLERVGVGRRQEAVRCPRCGAVMDSRGVKTKSIVTLLGEIRFARSAYQCPRCGATRYPGDEEVDAVQTGYSPGVRRLVADFASDAPFKRVSRQLQAAAALDISRKDCERVAEGVGQEVADWFAAERDRLRFQPPPPSEQPKTLDTLYIEFDGTGVPMVPHELEGRKGKQQDGTAKTREAKLGCVFTQSAFNEKGRPIRDPASASFVGAIETAAEFQWRIYAEAVRRGLFEARRVVCLTDGAEWIRNIVQTHFKGAQHIVDLYHAREHLVDLCKLLFGRDLRRFNLYKDRWWDDLDDGHIEKIIQEAQTHLPRSEPGAQEARTAIAYFETNKERMRYQQYFDQGLFVGSGVIEAACRTVVAQRMKHSGMEWTVRGANAIAALRCVIQSNRFEEFWEQRAA